MARSRAPGGKEEHRETVGNGGKERWKREPPFTDTGTAAPRVGDRGERGWGTFPLSGARWPLTVTGRGPRLPAPGGTHREGTGREGSTGRGTRAEEHGQRDKDRGIHRRRDRRTLTWPRPSPAAAIPGRAPGSPQAQPISARRSGQGRGQCTLHERPLAARRTLECQPRGVLS